jgi:uncharacterized membrane protein YccC
MSATTDASPRSAPAAAGGTARRATAGPATTPLLPVWSPTAAVRAARATVVVTGLFALTHLVIGNPQMALFAAFGSFATLVLTTFTGSPLQKLRAHTALALAGSALLTIGTAVNSSLTLAALVTLVVAFLVFFAGITGPNAASGATGALLAYVLPAASPGTMSMVPDRLAGWWLASVAGTAAVLATSPRSTRDPLREACVPLARALTRTLHAALRGERAEEGLTACMSAKRDLIATFTATPYRPTGLAAADQALSNSVELLEWCAALVADTVHEREDLRTAAADDRELLERACTVLDDVAALFAGGRRRPDLEPLERARTRSIAALARPGAGGDGSRADAQVSFHAHSIAVAVLALGAAALVASGLQDVRAVEARRGRWYTGGAYAARARLARIGREAAHHATLRSVWFINSARGAVALALAVAVADLSSVQHGFWVVLGTLSVLRTNAAATGSTALRALAGTAIGFVIGGALLVAIGAESQALWAALPIAVFVAAYAPGTAPFAVGQAAFTVTIAVLFNLLVPVGWKVGVVRIEDVAIGCGVSVLVGALFWPRGVAAVVGDDLADAFRSGASYLVQAVEWACGARGAAPDGAFATVVAASRLDEALRGFLAEQGTKHVTRGELWHLVGGALRLRLTAHAVAELPSDAAGQQTACVALDNRARTLARWYEGLAELLGRPAHAPVPALAAPCFEAADTVQESRGGSRYGVWLGEHLDHLAEHMAELVSPATRIAQLRRRPWWR